ncbi:uncharacterized protein LOC131183195 [Hevea brasiliensis]|uniref:uncharacterized protein LOC131183195 n=1 Tax=Hevea brasiliensis TaxID=3981 RepID=UPI0025E810F9|nr:uncharacterized protein LOC131183195 [Hevea brasiliensis]
MPVTNTHAVPWNYNFQVYSQSASSSTSIPTLNHTYTQPITTPKPCFTPHAHFKMTYAGPSNDFAPQFISEPALTNDSPNPEVEFITKSGRCYSTEEKKSKGKAKVGESPETEKKVGKVVEKGESSERKEEDELLLQIMKQMHRHALQKVLDQAFITPDITPGQFEKIVRQIQASNFITFSEDEIGSAGLKHTKALHVIVKCKGCLVAKLFIDNGLALNFLPNGTLARLLINPSGIRQSSMIVRVFDGTKREVLGDIDLPLQIGAYTFNVTFQVMDIEPTYTMLLERPWIHSANAVPSTLHQRIKYVMNGKIITVRGEEAMLVAKPQSVPYVETSERSLESSFQALELQGTVLGDERAATMVAKVMLKNGYEKGKGLGVTLDQKFDKPLEMKKDIRKISDVFTRPIIENLREKDRESPSESSINVLHQDSMSKILISPITEGQELDDWEAEDIPMLYF